MMLTIATRGGYVLRVEHEDDEFGVVRTPDGFVSPRLRVGSIVAHGYWEPVEEAMGTGSLEHCAGDLREP